MGGICFRCSPLGEEDTVGIDEELPSVLSRCDNCFRCNYDVNGDLLEGVHIVLRSTSGLRLKRKLSSFCSNCNISEAMICDECYEMLLDIEEGHLSGGKYKWLYCWPAFLWHMFSCQENQPYAYDMWRFIPITLRLMWLESYQTISKNHALVTLYEPQSYFEDVTVFCNDIDRLNASGTLRDLMTSCNKNCYCGVRCPWGCTEFVDECGYVAYHKLFYALLDGVTKPVSEKCISCGMKDREKHAFVGVRPDYLTWHENFFDNEEWPVCPCVRFIREKGPLICTCKAHDGGSSLRYLHPPRNPLTRTIPCTLGDQLAHAVVSPRMLKTIKCHKFNDTYQMQKCYGGFAGIDSCDVLEVGRFDRANIVSELNAALSLYGCHDIRSKLSQLVQSKVVPPYFESDKLKFVEQQNFPEKTELLRSALRGATFVSLEDSLKMHMDLQSYDEVPFHPMWPLSLLTCEPTICDYGCKPPSIPSFRYKQDLRLPWIMLSLATCIPMLWECIANSVHYKGDPSWHGWLLSFATKKVLQGIKSQQMYSKKGENSYRCDCKAVELCWKLESNVSSHEHPEGGYGHYSPHFNLEQVSNCLSVVKGVQVFSSVEELQVYAISGDVDKCVKVISLVNIPEDDEVPSSFTVSIFELLMILQFSKCCEQR